MALIPKNEHEEEDFAYHYTLDKDGNSRFEEQEVVRAGYELLQDDTIQCADCGVKLVSVIKVREDQETKQVKAQCPCGGESYLYEVVGKTFIQAVDGMTITDMPMDIKDGVMYITVKVIKNGKI